MYPFAVRSILLTHLHFLTWEITLRAIPWLCLLIVVDYGGYGFIARKKRIESQVATLGKAFKGRPTRRSTASQS